MTCLGKYKKHLKPKAWGSIFCPGGEKPNKMKRGKDMKKERIYKVTFDTQRNRRYITWGILLPAYNQSEAKDKAYDMWHSKENPHLRWTKRSGGWEWTEHPHMFHVSAARYDGADGEKEPSVFYIIENRAVTWGYRGNW